MKDIQYFLTEEGKFIASRQNEQERVWDEKHKMFTHTHCRLDYLLKKPFQTLMSIDLDKEKTYGLTDEENLMLACFLGPISYAFRDDYYTDALPEIVSEMQIILNQAIAKAPKFSGKVLYRFTHEYDQTEFRKGDIYQPSHNLTTTTEDWEQKCNVYVITPLPENETNAYCLFQIYNQGDEFQVSFLRGASFIITKIAKTDNSEYRRIYMTELKSSQQTRTIQLT